MMTVGMTGMVRRVRLAGLCSQVSAKAAEAMLENEKKDKRVFQELKQNGQKTTTIHFFDSDVLSKNPLFVT